MYSRLILLLPGDIDSTRFQNFFHPNDYIIAVDGGIEHITSLNIKPNLWIGDFDSCSPESKIIHSAIPTEAFPIDKNFLDTELALSKALELNVDNCVLIGGIGGRLDHQFALFMLLNQHSSLNILHTNGRTELHSLNNHIHKNINAQYFKYLSIIPITTLENVMIDGVKWPLHNATLTTGAGLSVSNQPINNTIHYSQNNGLGWLILTNE